MTTRRFLAPALLAITLAACSGGDAPPPADANAVEGPIVENMDFNAMVEPIAPPTATPTPTPTPEAPPVQEDEQVQADADAVGMTARVDRSVEDTGETDTEVPVEERK